MAWLGRDVKYAQMEKRPQGRQVSYSVFSVCHGCIEAMLRALWKKTVVSFFGYGG